jgi:hypothetical protein
MSILTLNLVFSTFVFWIAARIYLRPRLSDLDSRSIVLPILLLHSFRHLGLMFLDPGATYPGLPVEFAYPAAFGDLVAAMLAMAALPAVATNAPRAKALFWVFNVWGSVDLAAAIALATVHDAAAHMGPAFWIPAFWVPALLVTHYIGFVLLARGWSRPSRAAGSSGTPEAA